MPTIVIQSACSFSQEALLRIVTTGTKLRGDEPGRLRVCQCRRERLVDCEQASSRVVCPALDCSGVS